MSPNAQSSRFRLAAATAVFVFLALAATAGAVVYVYSNNFGSHGAFQEINQLGSGKKACREKYLGAAEKMRVTLKDKRFCAYTPPVEADADQPDHEVVLGARFKRNDATERAEKATYLAVRVRASGPSHYELLVHPALKTVQFSRNGDASGLPGGEDNAVNSLGKLNTLRLRVTGGQVTGFVNGQNVGSFTDGNPNQVAGRKVNFGPGFSRNVPSGPIALIERVQVGVPNP